MMAERPASQRQDSRRACVFRSAGAAFAVDGQFLSRVVDVDQITPVPRSSEVVLGVIAERGNILPLFSMAHLYKLDVVGGVKQALVIEHLQGEAALAVDEVIDFITLPAVSDENLFEHSRGSFQLADEQVNLLDIDSLIEALQSRLQAG